MQDEKKIKKSDPENEGHGEPESSASEYHPRVVVKFQDNIKLSYEDGTDRAMDKSISGQWLKLSKKFPGIEMNRLFRSLGPDKIRSLVERTKKQDPTYRDANLFGYFAVDCPPEVDPEAVAEALSSWRTVKTAYIQDGPTEPPVLVAPNDLDLLKQGYLGPAPGGIDAEYIWSKQGGDGEDVSGDSPLQFVDLERGWTLNHLDLNIPDRSLISGINKDWFGHGTAVLGIVTAVANNNLYGIGIAPRVTEKRVVSQWRDDGSWSTSEAILDAISVLNFGDVLLLEAQATRYGMKSLPIEVWDDVFDVIRLGTALGIIIVEAAGNGAHDLDNFRNPDPKKGLMFNRGPGYDQDSGAIMVGAAHSSAPHQRHYVSNYGSRIDCYAWGENIYTCGDGRTGNSTNADIAYFGGTSGAAAIIAGAALSVQGYIQSPANYDFRISPGQMRNILSNPTTGTASANGEADRIGVMPDLRKIIDVGLKRAPEIYIRDVISDRGEPHRGTVPASPDIILSHSQEPNPQTTFGGARGTGNRNIVGRVAKEGQDNYIYVRILNRGFDAVNVKATIYWAPFASLVTPDLWTEIDSVIVPSVPSGSITVSDAIVWRAGEIPGPGQYCFIGLIDNAGDPAPKPTEFREMNNFYLFISNNNNVAWRNFSVTGGVPV